jgi:hypothetical protein
MKVRIFFQSFLLLWFTLPLVACASNAVQTPSASAPTRSTVKVIVTESDGIPIQGAAVSINGKLAGETDANGILTVSGMSDGQITVSKEGYFTNTINAIKGQNGLKDEQTVWLTRSNSGGSGSTYSRGNLSRNQLRDMSTGITAAIIRVSRNLARTLPKNQKIAVLNITASDEDIVLFITDGIEQQLFDAGYSLVDRSQLDKIRLEQNFQLSGDVDDNQIVSIGKMAAAKVVVTGRITKMGNIQSLTLRALDVETGELITRASDQF